MHGGIVDRTTRVCALCCVLVLGLWQIWTGYALDSPPLAINEIAYRGTEASSSDEWIELHNTTSEEIDLQGWTLFIGSKAIALSGTVEGYGYYLLERTDDHTVADVEADLTYSGALSDQGVELRLENADGQTIDQVSEFFIDLSDPPEGISSRSSLERINPLLSGNVSFNWRVNDQVIRNGFDVSGNRIMGTPGLPNSSYVLAFQSSYPDPPQAPSVPDTPGSAVIEQVDHRLRLSWDSPAPFTFFRLQQGEQTIELGETTEAFVQPNTSRGISFQLTAFDLFLQESEAVALELVYALPVGPEAGEVLINELESMPVSGEKEWVELFNVSDTWKDLKDCRIADASNDIFAFSETDAIAPKGFFVAELSSQKLNNSGDTVELRCGAEGVLIDQVRYGSHSLGEKVVSAVGYEESLEYLPDPNGENTLGRSSDGSSLWFLFAHASQSSRGVANVDLRPVPGVSDPRFVNQGSSVRLSWTNPEGGNFVGTKVSVLHSETNFEYEEYGTMLAPESSMILRELPQELIQIRLVGIDANGRESEGGEVLSTFVSLLGLEITEVLPHPKKGEVEFIELYNSSDDWIDLTFFELNVANASADINDPSGAFEFFDFYLAPGEYFPLEVDPDVYGFRLSNVGSHIVVFDLDGFPVASIDYLAPPRGASVVLDGDLLATLYHPTPGGENVFYNAEPRAVITIQGSGKTQGCSVLNFNPTGANSVDADEDELDFIWRYEDANGQLLHAETKENPTTFKFTNNMASPFVVELTVRDPFGGLDVSSVKLELGVCAGRSNTSSGVGSTSTSALHPEYSEEVIVNEVFPNPRGKDKGQEFVELWNRAGTSLRLDGWKLGGKKKKSLNGLSIESGGYLVFYQATLRNGGDRIELTDPEGRVISELEYPEAIEGKSYNRGESDTLFWAGPTPGQKSDGRAEEVKPDVVTVVRIVDGDTIVVELDGQKETVRLIGVDTPETVHPFKPLERFGKEASAYTKSQLEGQVARLEYDVSKRGKYGRLLAYVFVNERHFNAELIQKGYAFAYLRFPFQHRDQFEQLEKEAKNNKAGLWAEDEVVEQIRQAQLSDDGELEELEVLEEAEENLLEEQEEVPEFNEEQVVFDQTGWEDLLLNEVLPNPAGKDQIANAALLGEYVEVINKGSEAVALKGWRVKNSKGKELVVFSEEVLEAGAVALSSELLRTIKNNSETLRLVDPVGTVRDELSYELSMKNNQVWSRNPLTQSWQVLNRGTPGSFNEVIFLTSDPDSDRDGLSDAEELRLGLNPVSWDSDGNGYPDDFDLLRSRSGAELSSYSTYLSDALQAHMKQTKRTLRFSGRARPYTQVELTLFSTPQRVLIPVAADGSWEHKVSVGLEAGQHRAEVFSIDPMGRKSLAQDPIPFTLTSNLNGSKLQKKVRRKISAPKPLYVLEDEILKYQEGIILEWNFTQERLQLESGQELVLASHHHWLAASLFQPGLGIRYALEDDQITIRAFELITDEKALFKPNKKEPLRVLFLFLLGSSALFFFCVRRKLH